MAFELPPLPYPKNALAPHMSEQTFDFHHGRHHQAYVTNLNNLIKDSPLERQSLEDLIKGSYKDTTKTGVFNNAAQVWNHTFFWNSMKPHGGGAPGGNLAAAITRDCGGLDKFKEQFKATAVGQFGSGWAWLVADKGAAQDRRHAERGHPAGRGSDCAPHLRRVGARLLPRLPEPPARFRPGFSRPSGELGFCRPEPGKGRLTKTDFRRGAPLRRGSSQSWAPMVGRSAPEFRRIAGLTEPKPTIPASRRGWRGQAPRDR